MTKKFTGLFGSSRWLMEPTAMRRLAGRLEAMTPEALHAAEASADTYAGSSEPLMRGDVAVIPICGPIFYKPSWYAMYFGGAILSTIRAQFRTALNDPNVKAIAFPFDSPGGLIDMVPECAKELFSARGQKPMIAIADTMIASAAYWLAASVDQIYVTESSQLGSIGVYAEHEEVSGMLERIGVKVTLIAYGEHKVDGNPYEPLSEAALEKIQADVNKAGEKFTLAVARGRGVTKKVVLDTFGQGQMFDGETAIKLGMADKIGAVEDVLGKMAKSRGMRGEPIDVAAVRALEDAAQANGVEPDADGHCPEGHEKDEDGMCYPMAGDAKAAAQRQADRDLTETTLALTDLRD